jgi:hypothetical protein
MCGRRLSAACTATGIDFLCAEQERRRSRYRSLAVHMEREQAACSRGPGDAHLLATHICSGGSSRRGILRPCVPAGACGLATQALLAAEEHIRNATYRPSKAIARVQCAQAAAGNRMQLRRDGEEERASSQSWPGCANKGCEHRKQRPWLVHRLPPGLLMSCAREALVICHRRVPNNSVTTVSGLACIFPSRSLKL